MHARGESRQHRSMFARESPISRDVQVRSAEGAKLLPIELLLFSTSWPRPAPTLPRPRCSLGLPQRRCNRSLPQPSLPPPAASRRCCLCKSRGQAPTRCSSEPSQRALPRVALQAPHVCIRPIRVDKFSVGLTYNCESYAVARHFPRNSFFRGLALALARVHRGARWRPACRLSRPAAPTVPVAAVPRATREHDPVSKSFFTGAP